MDISSKGLERARARAHAQTRNMLPDDEQRGAAIAAVEAACLVTPKRSDGKEGSAYEPATAAIATLIAEHVIDADTIENVRALASRIVRCFATVAAGEALDQLRENATTVAGGAR